MLKAKAASSAKITSFFSPATKRQHELQVRIANDCSLLADENKREEAKKKLEVDRSKREDQIVADIKRRLEASTQRTAPDTRSLEEMIRDEIEQLAGDDGDIFIPKKAKTWHGRPDGWKMVASYAQEHGYKRCIADFPEYFEGVKYNSQVSRIERWKKDLQNKKGDEKVHCQQPPSYGNVIDQKLVEVFDTRRAAGLSIDDVSLKQLLIPLLHEAGLTGLMKENGGYCTFGRGWAYRFYKRNNITQRVVTTKMRELPDDYNQKRDEYVRIGAVLISK
jgi:hypothetical protein